MLNLVRTTSDHPDFIRLVSYLDDYLIEKDGDDHDFYHQFNKIDALKYVVLVYENDRAIACGAMKEYSPGTMEIKRMYTSPESRGKGAASLVLTELETWAGELGYEKCILETGKRQTEAIGLYPKNGYRVIPNYGQYAGVDNSVCFEKRL